MLGTLVHRLRVFPDPAARRKLALTRRHSSISNAFALALTTGSDNPTSWFTVKVEGKAAEASLQKAENGYILTADDLENVTVSANNKTDSAKVSFSTKFESVLIYEIDANTIGVKADKDGDGVFETIVSTK